MGSVGVCQYAMTSRLEMRLTRDVESHAQHHDHDDHDLSGFTLRVTPTFDCGADPFSVAGPEGEDLPRILIREGTREVMRWGADVQQGRPVVVEGITVPDLLQEWFVEASPSPEAAKVPCALRVQVLKEGVLYADETLWSDGQGSSIRGRLQLKLAPRLNRLDRGLGRREE